MDQCWLPHPDGGVILAVRATPNAPRDSIEGQWRDASGRPWLSVRVRQPPENGRANDAIIALLARQINVSKRDIRLVSGDTARLKRFRLDGDSATLIARLDALKGQIE